MRLRQPGGVFYARDLMPKDDWAKARAMDTARRANKPVFWEKPRRNKRQRNSGLRKTWFTAIADCTTDAELSAIARSLAAFKKKLNSDYYEKLVRAGQRKRRNLQRTNSQ